MSEPGREAPDPLTRNPTDVLGQEVPAPDDAVAALIGARVLAVPGVVRLEAGLKDAVLRLRASRAGRAQTPGSGVSVSTDGRVTDVMLDVVASDLQPAVVTARAVRTQTADLLVSSGHRVGRVHVRVLGVEAADPAGRPDDPPAGPGAVHDTSGS